VDNIKHTNIQNIGIPEKEGKEKRFVVSFEQRISKGISQGIFLGEEHSL